MWLKLMSWKPRSCNCRGQGDDHAEDCPAKVGKIEKIRKYGASAREFD
jgi:hypothetical protein